MLPERTRPHLSWMGSLGPLALGLVLMISLPAGPSVHALDAAPSEPPPLPPLLLPSLLRYDDTAYRSPFGVSIFDQVNDTAGVPQMQAAGARRVFTNLRWVDLEPQEGQAYDFSAADAKTAAAQAAGFELVALFDHSPDWALVDPGNPRGPLLPNKVQAFLAVIAALAERYDGQHGHARVNDWLFYGEPDNTRLGWGAAPEAYADLLAQASPVIKAANPQARVMPGAIAYESFTDDEYLQPGDFARGFLPAVLARLNTYPGGAGAFIDGVGFNDFGLTPQRWPTLREKAEAVRQILRDAGVGQLPLIVTELSRTSKGGPNTEVRQAQLLIQVYARGLASGLEQLHWFMVFDNLNVPPQHLDANAYGLYRGTDLTQPKPAYTAYNVVAHELAGARYRAAVVEPGVEAYVFARGPETVTVAWASNGATAALDVALSCVHAVDRNALVALIQDGDPADRDGARNGQVRIVLTAVEPVILRGCP